MSPLPVLGFRLAFKPDIDDLQESLALYVMIAHRNRGQTLAVEPNVGALPASLDGLVTLADWDWALAADILVMLIDHLQCRTIDSSIHHCWIADTHGVWQ